MCVFVSSGAAPENGVTTARIGCATQGSSSAIRDLIHTCGGFEDTSELYPPRVALSGKSRDAPDYATDSYVPREPKVPQHCPMRHASPSTSASSPETTHSSAVISLSNFLIHPYPFHKIQAPLRTIHGRLRNPAKRRFLDAARMWPDPRPRKRGYT